MADDDRSLSSRPPQPPRLVGAGPSAELVRDCPSFRLGFTPAPWLTSPHAQTLYGVAREPAERLRRRLLSGAGASSSSSSSSPSSSSASGSLPNSSNNNNNNNKKSSWSFRRQLVHCEDGGTIALDWWEERRPRPKPAPPRRQQQKQKAKASPPLSSSPSSSPPSSLPPHTSSSTPLPPTAPILLVLHGLTGGSSEGYVKSLCAHASSRGFRAAAVVYRGCGGLRLTSPRAYSATFTGDVSRAAAQARREFPLAEATVAVGFSLGAVILSKYLGEQDGGYWHHGRSGGGGSGGGGREGTKKKHLRPSPHHQGYHHGGGGGEGDDGDGDDLIDAAVAVSSPFCLESAGEKLSRPWTVGWIYNAGLAIRLKHYMWSHRAQIFSGEERKGGDGTSEQNRAAEEEEEHAAPASSAIDRRALATSYLISHIDDAASARANGYADRRAYYADAATRKAVPHVTSTPLLFVSAADDPFLGELPIDEIESNPRTALVVTERGGHCAFVDGEGLFLGGSAWVDRLALEWLSRALARKKGKRGEQGGPSLLSKL